MSCDIEGTRLRNFYAGQTYEARVKSFRDEDGNKLDIEGRDYLLTLKRVLTLTDAQATGADGYQARITATAADSLADLVTLTIPAPASALLSGDYFADVIEIVPGSPAIVTPVIPLQTVTVIVGAGRSIA